MAMHVEWISRTGHRFEFVPFGCGRRSCPGITFAMEFTRFAIAGLVQGFDFAAPVEVNGGDGVDAGWENPLEVLVSPRLFSQLYQQL